MIIKDFVYGEFEITEPVLLEILESPFMERLKYISSGGFYPGGYPNLQDEELNRYHHSVGVFLLLRSFNAPLEEQIAGLIHDVSHSAFSHTVDHVFPEDKEDQKSQCGQDDGHEGFVMQTDIPDILKKYNIDLSYVLEDKNFPLEENDLPDICADRIDYSLRQGVVYGNITEEEKDIILSGLGVHEGSFYFKKIDAAEKFVKNFWVLDDEQWTGIKTAIMFCYNGKLLKKMIDKGYLSREDLFSKNDKEIIELFHEKAELDEEVKNLLDILYLPITSFDTSKEKYDSHMYLKVRKVNPLVLTDTEVKRYSELDEVYAEQYIQSPKYMERYLSLKK